MAQYVEEYSDVNVEGIDFFLKEEFDGYLYKDSECINRVNSAEMIHAFEMGDIIIVDGNYKSRPYSLNTENGAFVIYNKVVEENNEMEVVPTQVLAFDPFLKTDLEIGADTDLFGKVVSDLQENVVIGEDNITGTLKHITGYTGFSSKPEEQEGNYLVLHNTSNLGEDIYVELIGGTSGAVKLDSDGLIVLKIANNEQIVKVSCGNLVKEYKLTDLVLETE